MRGGAVARSRGWGARALPLPFPGPSPPPPPAPRPSQGAGVCVPRKEGGREAGRERDRQRERLSQIFMPLQAAAAAGKNSPRASAPFNPLPPSPPAALQSKCAARRRGPRRGLSPVAAPGPAAPSRQWAAAGPVGMVRPARTGPPPPPLLGLLTLLPLGLPAGAGGGPVLGRGVVRAGAPRQWSLEPEARSWEM